MGVSGRLYVRSHISETTHPLHKIFVHDVVTSYMMGPRWRVMCIRKQREEGITAFTVNERITSAANGQRQ